MWEILGTDRIWGLGQISTWVKLDIIPRVGFGVETWVFREKMTGSRLLPHPPGWGGRPFLEIRGVCVGGISSANM